MFAVSVCVSVSVFVFWPFSARYLSNDKAMEGSAGVQCHKWLKFAVSSSRSRHSHTNIQLFSFLIGLMIIDGCALFA